MSKPSSAMTNDGDSILNSFLIQPINGSNIFSRTQVPILLVNPDKPLKKPAIVSQPISSNFLANLSDSPVIRPASVSRNTPVRFMPNTSSLPASCIQFMLATASPKNSPIFVPIWFQSVFSKNSFTKSNMPCKVLFIFVPSHLPVFAASHLLKMPFTLSANIPPIPFQSPALIFSLISSITALTLSAQSAILESISTSSNIPPKSGMPAAPAPPLSDKTLSSSKPAVKLFTALAVFPAASA